MNQWPSDINFANTWAVVVSGASWNPCGHMLLCCGVSSTDSWYFQVAGQGVRELWGVRAIPKFMRGDGNFMRYLNDSGKFEIRRLDATIRDPSGAYNRLMNYMLNPWFWGVVINNCAIFVREIIAAGGGNLSVILNCPIRRSNWSATSRPWRVCLRGVVWGLIRWPDTNFDAFTVVTRPLPGTQSVHCR
jgi:hypothetical protein